MKQCQFMASSLGLVSCGHAFGSGVSSADQMLVVLVFRGVRSSDHEAHSRCLFFFLWGLLATDCNNMLLNCGGWQGHTRFCKMMDRPAKQPKYPIHGLEMFQVSSLNFQTQLEVSSQVNTY